MASLAERVAAATRLPVGPVTAALALFEEGGTVPFVARYRKERTGGLDEVALRAIASAQGQLQDLDTRLRTVLSALEKQGQLGPGLRAALEAATTRAELDDLYAPFKQRRQTRADKAREAGLRPLADRVVAQAGGHPRDEAAPFVRGDVGSVDAALAGARDIVAEDLALDPGLRTLVRDLTRQHGVLSTALKRGADASGTLEAYVGVHERAATVPSHRYLAICRGEAEGILTVKVRPDADRTVQEVARAVRVRRSPWADELMAAIDDATRRLLLPVAERAVRGEIRARADDEAIDVFARNLEALLLRAPFGARSVLGVDPGIRTGCKCALVDNTGTLVAHETVFLVGRGDGGALRRLLQAHRPEAVAVGNGTGGREAEAAVRDAVREVGLACVVVSVNEAGASVYSASDLAREELPDVDLTVRGAVSIARRLQDPLAELVKVDAQSLGVGQYQHDVDQGRLTERLAEVVATCVNRVGVAVNTASASLLAHVSGIGPKLAAAIVAHRAARGPFPTRQALMAVPGLGRKTFEQCAGFLRVHGAERLDATAVHPERYGLVGRIARDHGTTPTGLIGGDLVIDVRRYVDGDVGEATLRDIVSELRRPGLDPRDRFEAPAFRDDVREIGDLEIGMTLEGVVTNVTTFGAFVDLGVHCDGLVHVSQLAEGYVRDAHAVVKAGDRVTVRVVEIDLRRKRIGLSRKGL